MIFDWASAGRIKQESKVLDDQGSIRDRKDVRSPDKAFAKQTLKSLNPGVLQHFSPALLK